MINLRTMPIGDINIGDMFFAKWGDAVYRYMRIDGKQSGRHDIVYDYRTYVLAVNLNSGTIRAFGRSHRVLHAPAATDASLNRRRASEARAIDPALVGTMWDVKYLDKILTGSDVQGSFDYQQSKDESQSPTIEEHLMGDQEKAIQDYWSKQQSEKLYDEYIRMQSICGIDTGDTVKIARHAYEHEFGWGNSFTPTMSENIGATGQVKLITHRGICVAVNGTEFSYPFFALQLIKKGVKLPEPVKISGTRKAKFNGNGGISVGCQHIDFDTIEQIYNTAKQVKESNQ